MTELESIRIEARDIAARSEKLVRRIENLATFAEPKAKSYKIGDRLSPAGIALCYAEFDRGATPSEIAKLLDISIAAALYRKGTWERRKREQSRQAARRG